jgi:hypothetical protein
MPRVVTGNLRDLPRGMDAQEWAREVLDVMDDKGVDQAEAKQIVNDRHNDIDDEEDK